MLQEYSVPFINVNQPTNYFPKGSFGRRASDGGANLQIYYPATATNSQAAVEQMYVNTTSTDLRIGVDASQQPRAENLTIAQETGDESNDEIQR